MLDGAGKAPQVSPIVERARIMNRTVVLGALAAVIALGAAGFWARTRTPAVATADAAETLRPVQAQDGGTEPAALPDAPVLKAVFSDPGHIRVDFGYAPAGGNAYAYRLDLAFAPDADRGTMGLGARGGHARDPQPIPVERRWSESRNAYLVAVSRDLGALTPPIPSLCIRAVLGPSRTQIDLGAASLCAMQRDPTGRCHPSTLACGLLR